MEKHDISYKGQLKFISHFEPPLEAGRYRLEVSQQVKNFGDSGKTEETTGAKQDFVVSAPRFNLQGGDIFSQYPPKGGQADYDGVIASISFSRKTLPWERSPCTQDKKDGAAWLALLLVDEDELEAGTAREVYADEKARTRYQLEDMEPWLDLEDLKSWERYKADMPLKVLEIKDDLYEAIMPTYGDLKWLSHARQNINEAGQVMSSLGTVLCNRVPTPGKTNTVYLVSVEERYATTDDACEAKRIGDQPGGETGKQRLVVLHKWSFHCRDAELYGYTVTREMLLDAAREDSRIQFSEPLPDWVGSEYDGEEGKEALQNQVAQWLHDGRSPTSWMTDKADAILGKALRKDGYTATPEKLSDAAGKAKRLRKLDQAPDWLGSRYEGEEGEKVLRDQVLQWLKQDGGSPAKWMTEQAEAIVESGRHQEGTFNEILQNVQIELLRDAPEHGRSVSPAATQMLEWGHTVLKHHLRAGGKTYSWLKGALAPRELADMDFSFPAKSADDLLIFHQETGMFDASYAAAWSLGRLKGMENKAVSIALFRWRHEQLHAQVSHQHAHLPVMALPNSPLPEEVVEQVEAWKLLRGIPFEYLVPHPKLLPTEGLRFFYLDPNWMRCFIDGFFSVAKVHGLTDFRKEQARFPAFNRPITGVLLRSNAVAGWPSMHVNAYAEAMAENEYDPNARHIQVLRKEQLQSEVLLLLFDGVPRTLDFYLSPEGLHSGFERDDTFKDGNKDGELLNSPRYTHRVRHPETGVEIETFSKVVAIGKKLWGPNRTEVGSPKYRTFSAKALEQKFEERVEKLLAEDHTFSAGDLGLQLIDGSPLVRYQLSFGSG